MTAPKRIWASPSVDGFLDAIDHFDASCWDMAPYVRADLYDAAVAERDATVKLAEVRLAQFENERRAARLTEDALLKAVAERDEARAALKRAEAERDSWKPIVENADYWRDAAMEYAERVERERDAARAEVDLLRKVAKAADDACGAVDEEIERDALARALAAYRAAKEGKP